MRSTKFYVFYSVTSLGTTIHKKSAERVVGLLLEEYPNLVFELCGSRWVKPGTLYFMEEKDFSKRLDIAAVPTTKFEYNYSQELAIDTGFAEMHFRRTMTEYY